MKKTLLFFRATDNQIEYHLLPNYFNVYLLADYYDHEHASYGQHIQIPVSTGEPTVYYDDRIYKISSNVYTASEIKEKYANITGTWVTATLAYELGHILQPDREIDLPEGGTEDYEFSLGIVKDDLKKQCSQDISESDENKAHSLKLKDSPTQEETDFMSTFLTDRQSILDQYETDKITLGM